MLSSHSLFLNMSNLVVKNATSAFSGGFIYGELSLSSPNQQINILNS